MNLYLILLSTGVLGFVLMLAFVLYIHLPIIKYIMIRLYNLLTNLSLVLFSIQVGAGVGVLSYIFYGHLPMIKCSIINLITHLKSNFIFYTSVNVINCINYFPVKEIIIQDFGLSEVYIYIALFLYTLLFIFGYKNFKNDNNLIYLIYFVLFLIITLVFLLFIIIISSNLLLTESLLTQYDYAGCIGFDRPNMDNLLMSGNDFRHNIKYVLNTDYASIAEDMRARCEAVARNKVATWMDFTSVSLGEIGITNGDDEHEILKKVFPRAVYRTFSGALHGNRPEDAIIWSNIKFRNSPGSSIIDQIARHTD